MRCAEVGRHLAPIHLNRGRHGNVWLCLNCEAQLGGPPIELDPGDYKILIEYLKLLADRNRPKGHLTEGDRAMKLTVHLEGKNRTELAEGLKAHLALIEGKDVEVPGKRAPKADTALANGHDTDTAPVAVEPGKKGKKAAKAAEETFDLGFETEAPAPSEEEEETEVETPAEEEEEAEEPAVSLDDVRKAFKTFSAPSKKYPKGRIEDAKKILDKVGVKSVNDLKPAQFEKVIALVSKA